MMAQQMNAAGAIMWVVIAVGLVTTNCDVVSPFVVRRANSNIRHNSISISIRRAIGASTSDQSSYHRHHHGRPTASASWRRAAIGTAAVSTDGGVVTVPGARVVDRMPGPLSTLGLQNQYYLLRHGQSTANVAGIISSARSLAYSNRHGLTGLGYEQGVASASELLDAIESLPLPTAGAEIIFISSPFARARQTARACIDGLLDQEPNQARIEGLGLRVSSTAGSNVVLMDQLMERYFGRLDNEELYNYAFVWPVDKFNVTHTAFDVESVAAVCYRIQDLVNHLETRYQGCHIVLVSHADVLQIAQLYAANVDNVGLFSSYRFGNGEVRPMLVNSTDALPEPAPLEPPRRGT